MPKMPKGKAMKVSKERPVDPNPVVRLTSPAPPEGLIVILLI